MKKAIAALLLIASIGLTALFNWMRKQDDNVPPVITFPSQEVTYVEGQDTEVLLEGVKAEDDVDGDVSDTLVVESVMPMQNQTQATVLYYAKDDSNNVTKANRVVGYRSSETVLWMAERETEEAAELPETETDTMTWELPQGSPRITLTTKRVTVKQGENYDLLSYVKSITDDVDGPDWLYGQIHIDGMNDISGPGVYDLYYSVIDREGNQSNQAKLVLTIE